MRVGEASIAVFSSRNCSSSLRSAVSQGHSCVITATHSRLNVKNSNYKSVDKHRENIFGIQVGISFTSPAANAIRQVKTPQGYRIAFKTFWPKISENCYILTSYQVSPLSVRELNVSAAPPGVCAADQLIRCLGLNSGGKALISPPPRLSAANGDPFRGKHGEPISCAPRSAVGPRDRDWWTQIKARHGGVWQPNTITF